MALTSCIIAIICAPFVALCIWLSVKTNVALLDPVALETESLTSLYFFAVFGTIAIVIILGRSLQINRQRTLTFNFSTFSSSANNSKRLAPRPAGVSVDIDVLAEIDDAATLELTLRDAEERLKVPEMAWMEGVRP